MTERDLTYELLYTKYVDMENGDDVESIDYRSLIHIMTEMMTRIEQLEKWKENAQKSARIVKQTLDAKND